MGKQKTEIRTFLGGVNSDDTPSFIGKDEVLNAINTTTSNPYGATASGGQDTGAIRSLYGKQSTTVTSLLDFGSGTYTLLGKVADDRTKKVFLLYYHSLGDSKIIELSKSGASSILFKETYAIEGLKWNPNIYISVRLSGNNLIFTDPINGVRFIDITKSYTVGSVSSNELSFARTPIAAPLSCSRVTDTSVFNFSAQLGTFQFCVRLKDVWGYETVLSPLSTTVYPARQSDIDTNSFFGNTVKASLNFGMLIPNYWDTIDFVVKNLSDNTYSVYRTFNKNIAVDVTAVTNHNAGTTALNATYSGVELYVIDDNNATKQFEAIPITSEHLEVMENRLLLANNTNGYDTPTILPTNLLVSQDRTNTVMPASSPSKVYMITAKNYDLTEDEYPVYAALFVAYDNKIWGLPKEYSVLRMNGEFVLKQQNTDNHPYPYLPPQTVHKNSLIELPNYFALDANTAPIGAFSNPFSYLETLADATNNGFFLEYPAPSQYYIALPLAKYVWDMHELGESPTGSWGTDPIYSGVPGPSYVGISRFADYSIYIFNEADEYAPSGFGRAFLPNATYNLGLRYYDYALRSCGNQEIEKVKIQDYNPFDREVTESITVAITGANTAPDWAKYFAVTLSKNNICQNFINFTPTIIKIARKTNEGIIYVTSDWFNKIESDELYGLAIPLDALQSYGQGYSYSEGDYIRLDVATGTPITYSSSISYNAAIIGVVNGHIIANAPDIDPVLFTLSGYLSSQYDKINSPVYDGTLLAPISASPSLMTASFRQSLAYATIYQQKQADINNYEVAAFGYCNVVSGTNRLDSFYSGTSTASSIKIFGDCHTQERASNTGSFTGIANTSNERISTTKWLDISGRISPIDNVGQTKAINEIKWSNVGDQTLNSNINGMNRFDALDYTLTNYSSGAINMILGDLGDLGRSETLLIICASGGYATLLNQNLIRNTDGNGQLVASSKFIDNIVEINGNPATSSPRSFAASKKGVFWADVLNKQVLLYNQGKAEAISDNKARRLFYSLFKNSEQYGNEAKIYGGFHDMGGEYILGYKSQAEEVKLDLITTDIEYPLDYYYQQSFTWLYNADSNKWSSIIPKMLETVSISDKVYAWDFVGQSFDIILNPVYAALPDYDCIIAIPFNSEYDKVKSILALKIDANRPPDETWVQTNVNTRNDLAPVGIGTTQVARAANWIYREGDWYCSILRNRLSAIPTSETINDFNGTRVKGKVVNVILVYKKETGHFVANSCSLAYESPE